jgi:predicted homoserine dehydrogenase-like protein
MLTSFVDGSKAMIEMASLANTTGLGVSKRGMHGPPSSVATLHETFALTRDGGIIEQAGVVDYCTGDVAPGVFVIIRTDDPYVHHEMTYLQMGDGPYFALYRPYHLASIEAPLTVYEIVLDQRPSLTSEHWTAEVGAQSKRPLRAGERIDGIGGMMVRGLIDPAEDFARDGLVPLGVLAGATLKRDVPVDHTLTYDDVDLDESSLIVRMRRIQESMDDGSSSVPSLAELSGLVAG